MKASTKWVLGLGTMAAAYYYYRKPAIAATAASAGGGQGIMPGGTLTQADKDALSQGVQTAQLQVQAMMPPSWIKKSPSPFAPAGVKATTSAAFRAISGADHYCVDPKSPAPR